MSTVVRRAVSLASWVLLSLLLMVAACLLLAPHVLPVKFHPVLTGSMEPAMPVGSVVVVVPVTAAEVSVGDVLTFDAGGRRVTHRVVEIRDDQDGRSFITKGDANNVADGEPVPAAAVAGRVWCDIPWLGRVAEAVRTPVGIGTLTGLGVGLFLLGSRTKRRDGQDRPSDLASSGEPRARERSS